MARWIYLLWALVVIGGDDCRAEDHTVLVIGPHLEGRLDDSPDGGYAQLARELFPPEDTRFHFQRLPMVRSVQTFANADRVCLMPTDPGILAVMTGLRKSSLIASDPIDIVSSHFFFRSEAVIDQNVFRTPGKRLVKQRGLDLRAIKGDELKADLMFVPEMSIALKMLEAGRMDAMYGWYPDVMIISEQLGLRKPAFELTAADITIETAVTCKAFGGVGALLDRINTRLAELKKSGQLVEMLGPYARVVSGN